MTEPSALAIDITQRFSMPAKPEVIKDVEKQLAGDAPDINAVGDVIRADVALSGAMLQIINSPTFRLPEKITAISEAVRALGPKKAGMVVRNVALKNSQHSGGFERYWDTATEVATVTEMLAMRLTGLQADEAYLMGLFHDCGIPLMIQMYSDFKRTLSSSEDDPPSLSRVELQTYGVHHYEVGSLMGENWFLPESISTTIGLLPKFERVIAGEGDETEDVKQLLGLTIMAKSLSGVSRKAWRSGDDIAEIPLSVLKFFELSQADYEDLADSILARIQNEADDS